MLCHQACEQRISHRWAPQRDALYLPQPDDRAWTKAARRKYAVPMPREPLDVEVELAVRDRKPFVD